MTSLASFLRPETFESLRWQTERERCATDFPYLCRTYLHYKSKDAMGNTIGRPKLELNRAQRVALELMQDQHRRIGYVRYIFGKGRQLGMSTLFRAISFHQVTFWKNRNALLITHDEPSSLEMFRDFDKTWVQDLPEPLRPILTTDKRDTLEFKKLHTRSIANHAMNQNVGASQMTHMFHYTEATRVTRNADAVWAALTPSLSPARSQPGGGFLRDHSIGIIESTSRFGGDWFKEVAERARAGQFEDWEFYFFPWTLESRYSRPVPLNFTLAVDEIEIMRRYPDMTLEQMAWRRAEREKYIRNPLDFYSENPLCLVGETRVSTEKGIIPLGAIEREGAKNTESGPVLAWIPQGPAPVFTVTTSRGFKVTGTHQHRLIAPDGTAYFLGESLGREIALAAPRFAEREYVVEWSPIPSASASLRITPQWGRFLGIFMGDGSYHPGKGNKPGGPSTLSVAGTLKDMDFIESTRSLITDLFGRPTSLRSQTPGGCEIRSHGAVFFEPLMRVGAIARIGPEQRWKRYVHVPDVIWRSPQPVVSEFLRGLFETDGTAHHFCTMLFSKYPDLIADVQILLLGFGISSTIAQVRHAKGYTGVALRLTVSETRQFNESIGFLSARKRAATRTEEGVKIKSGRPLKPIATSDVIVSVEPSGTRETYDLTLPAPHTFSANGLLVHNSWEESWVLPKGVDRVFPYEVTETLRANGPVMPGVRVDVQRPTQDNPNSIARLVGGPVEVWEMPEDNIRYHMGLDLSGGKSSDSDWTVGQIVREDNLRQVAEFRLRIDPASTELEDLVYWLAMAYNTAQINVDITGGWGYAIMEALRRRGYPSIYTERRYESENDMTTRMGFTYTHRLKAMLVTNAVTLASRGEVIIHSNILLEELEAFVQIPRPAVAGQSQWPYYGARQGSYDDACNAWMLALLSARDERGGIIDTRPEPRREYKVWETKPWAALDIDAVFEADSKESRRMASRSIWSEV